MTKNEKIKFAYLITYTVILVVGIVFYALFKHTDGGAFILIFDIAFGVLGGIGFIILHNRITKYHCHHCGNDFKASIMDTVVGEDKGINYGKKSVCSVCKEKDYYKAVREKD
jgi:hypothetical protein